MPEPDCANTPLATDQVTFLFTDIEGSTRLWEETPDRMRPALARHDAISRTAVESHRGVVVKMTGDGIYAAFDDALNALAAAVDLQQALADPATTNGISLRVRCGLHLGIVERRDNDFFGPPLNRAARIMNAAHGGQVLMSQAVVNGVQAALPAMVSLRDLGRVRLKDLSTPEHVYQVVHPDLRQEFPALRSLEATPNNLPQQMTSFVGRERTLAEVRQLLSGIRLLTLVGVGGLGKTRLSLHIGADVLDDYPDGVWFVELAPLTDGGLLPRAVATVMGVKEESGRSVKEALLNFVKDRQLLLILDNCEHLAPACAELAKDLLQSSPRLKVLASSRESLHVVGETIYPLSTLAVPDAKELPPVAALTKYDSVHLFCDRAVAAQPSFQLSAQNVSVVAEICRRLDGIPLALELAAARVRSMSLGAIAERLSDRFHLLTGGDATALPRQQTLRACIGWSHDLLTGPERTLLRRLAVFAGGWTLPAAEAVGTGGEVDTSNILDLMTHLVEKSLVEFDAANARYGILETIREYVIEGMQNGSDIAQARSRHLDYFLQCAESAESALSGGTDVAGWPKHLIPELDNLRAAMTWSVEVPGGGHAALRLCGALYMFWLSLALYREGRERCEAALRHSGDSDNASVALTKTLLGRGALAQMLGDNATATGSFARALELSRMQSNPELECRALAGLGHCFYRQEDYALARAQYAQGLKVAKEIGNASRECVFINGLAVLALIDGDASEARLLATRQLELARHTRSSNMELKALAALAGAARNLGDLTEAEQHIERALTICQEIGVSDVVSYLFSESGGIAVARGDLFTARSRFREALSAYQKSGSLLDIANLLDEIVLFAAATSAHRIAAILGGAIDGFRVTWNRRRPATDAARFESSQQSSRDYLGNEQYLSARETGERMTVEEALVVASKILEGDDRY